MSPHNISPKVHVCEFSFRGKSVFLCSTILICLFDNHRATVRTTSGTTCSCPHRPGRWRVQTRASPQ